MSMRSRYPSYLRDYERIQISIPEIVFNTLNLLESVNGAGAGRARWGGSKNSASDFSVFAPHLDKVTA